MSPDDLLLRMGEYDLNSDGEPYGHIDRKVQIVASHPKFDPKTFEYDLALLRFYDKVDFQPNVVPICVPETERDLVGETAWVTGWGRLYEGWYAKIKGIICAYLVHNKYAYNETVWVLRITIIRVSFYIMYGVLTITCF